MNITEVLWSLKYYIIVIMVLIVALVVFFVIMPEDIKPITPISEPVSSNVASNAIASNQTSIKASNTVTLNTNVVYPIIAITVISILLAIISIILTYRIYSDHSKIKQSGAMVPEEWADHLLKTIDTSEKSDQHVLELAESQQQFLKFFNQVGSEFNKQIKENKDILYDFQKALDAKDIEIKKYQNGYDISILKDFLSKIVDVYIGATETFKSNPENKNLRNYIELLWQALSFAGVEEYFPKKGMLFSDSEVRDFVEVAGHVETEDEGIVNGEIAEVLSAGYVIIRNEKKIVLGKSKIKYFVKEG